MGHYPIKCVFCGEIITNQTVLFNTDLTSTDFANVVRGQNVNQSVLDANEPEDDRIFARDSRASKSQSSQATAATRITGKLSLADIMDRAATRGHGEARGIYQEVHVTADFIDAPGYESEDLLTEVEFPREKGGEYVRTNKRCCPRCKKDLPSNSGAMPTYIICVIGATDAGKTVYLCAMCHTLDGRCGNLPYNGKLTASASGAASNEIFSLAEKMFNTGYLPATTQIDASMPFIMRMTFNGPGSKQCIFALADMRGEDLSGQANDGKLGNRASLFTRADGFLFVVSPRNLKGIQAKLETNPNADFGVHSRVMNNISEEILPKFAYNVVNKPTVVMLSMSDILSSYRTEIGLSLGNPVIAPSSMRFKYESNYFNSQRYGTIAILRSYDPAFAQFIRNSFSDLEFTASSSLGNGTKLGRDENNFKYVLNHQMMASIRVEDPIILLLIRLGFLPAFNQMQVPPLIDKHNEALVNQIKQKNNALMQAWMKKQEG